MGCGREIEIFLPHKSMSNTELCTTLRKNLTVSVPCSFPLLSIPCAQRVPLQISTGLVILNCVVP